MNAGAQNITVFANAGSLDGMVNATRTINSNDFVTYGPILDACLDTGGRLLVVASGGKRVLVFNNAGGLNGDVSPAGVLTVSGSGSLGGVVVDAAGTGYVTGPDLNQIYVYENISARTGTVDADRIVSGDATGLSSPWRMCLVPR